MFILTAEHSSSARLFICSLRVVEKTTSEYPRLNQGRKTKLVQPRILCWNIFAFFSIARENPTLPMKKIETITFLKHFLSVFKSVYVLEREAASWSSKNLQLKIKGSSNFRASEKKERGKVKSWDINRLNYLKASKKISDSLIVRRLSRAGSLIPLHSLQKTFKIFTTKQHKKRTNRRENPRQTFSLGIETSAHLNP